MHVVRAKIDKEVALGRVSGPFRSPPLPHFVVSPLGLVPKKEPGEFRLIHDLSFPKHNSVNSHIPSFHSSVQFEMLDDCVEHVVQLGPGALMAKADLQDAFRIVPIAPTHYRLLGFKLEDGFYFDRCLPMGCAVSCAMFETLSRALQWILCTKMSVDHMSHILDDFIFFGPPQSTHAQSALDAFTALCQDIGLPIKHSKTVLPSTRVQLHGILVDSTSMSLSLPADKVTKLVEQLSLYSRRKRMSLKELQSLIGSLNFACRVVVPGRAFCRRLIDLTVNVSHPDHTIRLNNEARRDMSAWLLFLKHFNGVSACLPNEWSSSEVLRLFSDASGDGFAAVYGDRWLQGSFPTKWSRVNIAVKEMCPIVFALKAWGHLLSNKRVLFMCDNEAVVQVINKQSCKLPLLMQLVRSLVVSCMACNVHFRAKHLPGLTNTVADALSRFQYQKARAEQPSLLPSPDPLRPHWLPWS